MNRETGFACHRPASRRQCGRMTDSAPTSNRPKPTPVMPARVGESFWQRAIPFVIFTLIVFVVLVLMTMIFGQVSGEEFCPDTFERRRFHYYQIPILRIQVTGVSREDAGIGMASTVADHAPNVVTNPTSKTWDLVSSSRVGAFEWLGDAKILCDLLTIRDANRKYAWEEWSETYPKLADAFWPVVADVAQAGSYILMPELFDLAENAGYQAARNNPPQEVPAAEATPDRKHLDQDDESKEKPKEDDEQSSENTTDAEQDDETDAPDIVDVPSAEVDAFQRKLEAFVGEELIILAQQFEDANELRFAKRAYQLATEYSGDPAAAANLERLTELVPDNDVFLNKSEDENPVTPESEQKTASDGKESKDPQ